MAAICLPRSPNGHLARLGIIRPAPPDSGALSAKTGTAVTTRRSKEEQATRRARRVRDPRAIRLVFAPYRPTRTYGGRSPPKSCSCLGIGGSAFPSDSLVFGGTSQRLPWLRCILRRREGRVNTEKSVERETSNRHKPLSIPPLTIEFILDSARVRQPTPAPHGVAGRYIPLLLLGNALTAFEAMLRRPPS